MKKILHVITFILLFIWQLPQCLLGLLMMPFMGKLELISYKKYCFAFNAKNMPSGIAVGCFIFFSPNIDDRKTVVEHEYGHCKDSKLFSWLYLIIIGLPSVLNNIFKFTDCYYSWYPERSANKNAGLDVDSLCRLYFINKKDAK